MSTPYLDHYNAGCNLLIAIAVGIAVMHPRVNDGIVAKLGLACISVAHLALFVLYIDRPATYLPFGIARALVHTGLLLLVLAYALRVRRTGFRQRRAGDWIDLGRPSHGEPR